MKVTAILVLPLFISSLGFGQNLSPQAPPPAAAQVTQRFEAATLKLGAPGPISYSSPNSTQFHATSVPLKLLIAQSYGVLINRVIGGPSWIDSQCYDVRAKVEGDTPLTFPQTRPLLINLLKERLHLDAKRIQKEENGYILIVANKGLKMKQSEKGTNKPGEFYSGYIQLPSATTQTLANVLERIIDVPVENRTGLSETFSIKMSYAPETTQNSSLPSLFTALEEQLGLKLIPQKISVEYIEVKYVDRVPVED